MKMELNSKCINKINAKKIYPKKTYLFSSNKLSFDW